MTTQCQICQSANRVNNPSSESKNNLCFRLSNYPEPYSPSVTKGEIVTLTCKNFSHINRTIFSCRRFLGRMANNRADLEKLARWNEASKGNEGQ